MNDIELCQELMKRAEEYQKRKAREFAIAELEKIKAEIEEIDNIVHEHGATYINKYGIVKVFNKHISELKGESNAE